MLKFTQNDLRIEVKGITIVLRKSFQLIFRDLKTRIFKNDNEDLLTFTSSEIHIAHGTLWIVLSDPEVCRDLRSHFS
jgi:hypothetical protein